MNLFEKVVYVVVLIAVLAGLVLAQTDPEFFRRSYVQEDSLIEWATAIALFLGSLLMFKRFWTLRKYRHRIFAVMTLLAAMAFFFGAGEEISWGQRVLKIKTPKAIKHINTQGEINFHNLRIGDVKLNKLIFSQLLTLFLVLYLIALPLFYKKNPKLKRMTDRFGIPVAKLHQILFYLLATGLVSAIPHNRKWELMEFAGSLVFLLILSFPKNHEIYDASYDSGQS